MGDINNGQIRLKQLVQGEDRRLELSRLASQASLEENC
jgi:hypothetical protein